MSPCLFTLGLGACSEWAGEVYEGRPPSVFSELPSGLCSSKQGLEAWASFEVFLQPWDMWGWRQTPPLIVD